MNLLLELPEEYRGVPVSADFRNMIRVDLILREEGVSDAEKTMAALNQLYPEIPSDLELALDGLVWFFSRGEQTRERCQSAGTQAPPRAFDYDQDANLIYAAFYAVYGLSLTTVEFLHWWEFLALFEGLPEDTLIKRVMYWRTANLGALPREERRRIQKLRQLFALRTPGEPESVEALERRTKEELARRYEEAARWRAQQRREPAAQEEAAGRAGAD